jgi:hypothetical protein
MINLVKCSRLVMIAKIRVHIWIPCQTLLYSTLESKLFITSFKNRGEYSLLFFKTSKNICWILTIWQSNSRISFILWRETDWNYFRISEFKRFWDKDYNYTFKRLFEVFMPIRSRYGNRIPSSYLNFPSNSTV